MVSPRPVVFGVAAEKLQALLPRAVVATSYPEFVKRTARRFSFGWLRRPSVGFVASQCLPLLVRRVDTPIVAVIDAPAREALGIAVDTFAEYPWLSHVITTAMLQREDARARMDELITRLVGRPIRPFGNASVGRVARLANAGRRGTRLERAGEFFEKHGLSPRATKTIVDVVEELVMNALYDAPYEGKYLVAPVQRTEDIELPAELACEISYGIDGEIAFVRVRDAFGALARGRMMDVLRRCNANGVSLDESRGGAGLGLWRVFTAASMVAVTVVPHAMTEIYAEFTVKQGRVIREPRGIHCFFAAQPKLVDEIDIPDDSVFDKSVTLVQAV